MKTLVATSVIFLSLAAAASSFAAAPVTATLAAALEKPKTVVAGGGVWRCADTTCRLSSEGSVDSMLACRQLVKQVGQVTALGAEGKEMAAERITSCNARR